MTTNFQRGSPMTFGELGHMKGAWVKIRSNLARSSGPIQTQLLFSEAMPTSTSNRATRVGPPAPIVIEKLVPRMEEPNDVDSDSSSLRFSVLSEDRLHAAVRLAKRDLRRRRQESINSSPLKPEESPTNKSNMVNQQKRAASKDKQKSGNPNEVTKSEVQVLVYSPQKLSAPPRPEHGLSPPTRDPGLKASSQEPQLSHEIRRLQKELGTYIQRIEHLASRGRVVVEPLEPDEQRRMEVRRQEQATRSARIIYVLQQQVKEIQEDLEKLRSQNFRHTKKSRAMDRLAAAHRGAVRAMQVFINQLSDPVESRVPSHCKELGQLIRQLSLCSAKVEVGQGSVVPETALDILQKLETLDTAISKQESPRVRSASPVRQRSPRGRHHSTSPPRATRGLVTRGPQRSRKPAAPKKKHSGRRLAVQQHRVSEAPRLDRSELLRAGLETLICVREGRGQERAEPHTPSKHGGGLHPERTKGSHVREAGFQQPTVSSRQKESQLPQREAAVAWKPTSPHSPPQQRTLSKRPEPRCLFSPLKTSTGLAEQQGKVRVTTQQGPDSDKNRQAHNEALREAWLEKVTADRLRELNQLSKEEAERISRLRSELGSPTQWAEKAEHAARDRLQPLLDRAQQIGESWDRKGTSLRHQLSEQAADKMAVSADQLSEAILEELLDDTARALWAAGRDRQAEGQAQRQLEAPTLESMLLRMEEMEKDQEAVRRRFAHISYSDPLFWDKAEETGPQRKAAGPRPASPQPIRLTKPALRQKSTVDIVLESPVDTGVLSETAITDDGSPPAHVPSHALTSRLGRGGGTQLSVPDSMQRNILGYREDYDSYLRLVSHEAVGHFNPWAIADSLAEELMTEALADVAVEFQDVCEEYAEAVFTSEFLQPMQSPASSVL